MAYTTASRKALRKIIDRIKNYYETLVDRHSAPEAGYVPGGSPSESPELCYGMWSRCAFPAMFDDVTPSDVKAAFRLWFRELGRPLPDVLYAAPMFGDSEGSPSDESTESVESSDELSSSDVESDAGSESAESSSSDSFHPIEAAACHAPHVPSYAFPSSSRAFFDAESGSDSDSDWHPYEDDDQTRLLLGSVHLSEPSVPPPSPSSASIGDLSSYSSSWNDHDRGLDVSNASGKAVCDQEEDDIVAARGLYYADSTTSCADFVFDGDDLIFDASKDDFYTLFTPSDDELPPPTTAVASRLDEVDRPTLPSSSRELASEFLGTGPRETEGKDLDPTVAKAKPAVGDEVAAAPDLQESLPSLAISGVTPEEMCSAEDGTKEHERVVAQLASTSQTGVEVTQASTSATMIRGTKRKREAEEASDDVDDMAGPSTKKMNLEEPEAEEHPCPFDGCPRVFKNKGGLHRHLRCTKAHAQREMECPQCHVKVPRLDSLRRHLRTPRFAECLAAVLADMKVERLEQCTARAMTAKYGVARTTPREEAA